MLHVVTRHENEGIVIGDSVHVTVLEIGDDQIRLGISSPEIDGGYREEVICCQPGLSGVQAVGAHTVAAGTDHS